MYPVRVNFGLILHHQKWNPIWSHDSAGKKVKKKIIFVWLEFRFSKIFATQAEKIHKKNHTIKLLVKILESRYFQVKMLEVTFIFTYLGIRIRNQKYHNNSHFDFWPVWWCRDRFRFILKKYYLNIKIFKSVIFSNSAEFSKKHLTSEGSLIFMSINVFGYRPK